MKNLVIAFLGSDGSGKSTLISALEKRLSENKDIEVIYEHSRPNLLPPLGTLFGKKEVVNDGEALNPHQASQSGIFVSLLRFCYYLIDYSFGFFIKITIKRSAFLPVYIFDRYFYDFFVDPRRSRICLPRFVFNIGKCLIPEPHLVFCLVAEPQIIFDRKPELPLEEVVRQVAEFRKLAERYPRMKIIDTGEGLDVALNTCYDEVASLLYQP